ncbi:hypothetical protein TNCV_3305251 [Trichonephila clavipes]|nr:hypothetical protein TNCV_3305251 [Trichonephila clavipes]
MSADSFTTKNGLLNHQNAHKQKKIAERMFPLSLPDGPKERKAANDRRACSPNNKCLCVKQNDRRMAPVSTGEPGDMPLAPPPDDATSTPSQRVVDPAISDSCAIKQYTHSLTHPAISEREPTRGRIDIQKPTITVIVS